MTTEEKARAYDEALKRFKSFKEKYYTRNTYSNVFFDKTGNMPKDFEEIFPELREDEDEKIVNWLIRLINTGRYRELESDPMPCLRGKLVAYLEKQKEQNVVPSRETILGIWELGNFWKENPEERDGLTQLQYIQKYWFEKCDYQNYQKEQKPNYCHHEVDETGWTEEYRKAYYDGWNNCNQQHSQLKAEQKPAEYIKRNSKELYALLAEQYSKGFREGKVEQNPAWSKEDEDIINEVASILINDENRADNKMEEDRLAYLAEKIQSLRPQPKQEWSKEDERMIDTIVSVLSQYMDYKAVSDTGSGSAFATPRYSKEIDWLNSLRPQWRPSGEQMMALRRAVNKLSNSDTEDSVRLSIMHDNLKKLM